MTVTKNFNKPDPWQSDNDSNTTTDHYPSHFVSDRWGHYINNTSSNQPPYGVNVWDARNHTNVVTFTDVPWSEHHDWSAFSDWLLASASNVTNIYETGLRIVTQNYKSSTSQKALAYAHTDSHGGTTSTFPYEAYPRPTQSPDGTKAMFHSTFLNANDSTMQVFWTVAYYPYPPEIKSAAKVSTNVRLTWDFNQGTSCAPQSTSATRTGPTPNFTTPRTYATRGWPHETLDCPPSPREIKQFRVWTSPDNTAWTPAGTTAYNNCSGTNECGMWTETAWTYDYAQANSSTRYYAVTSLEHSGLESRTLSNVWKVTLDANGNIFNQSAQAIYPTNPGGKSGFYTVTPAGPSNIVFTSTVNAGQYAISWSAPTASALIRYYNIYAADGAAPTAVQQKRVASIPATSDYSGGGNFKYIDWLGNVNGSTKYLVTSVDYQGNESAVGWSKAPTLELIK